MSYNRYSRFYKDGTYSIVPNIKITKKSSDYLVEYNSSSNRLDMISNTYYGDPNYDWLIMMANPEYGSMEFDIPDGTILRVPYPLKETIDTYNKAVDVYNTLNIK